MDWIASYKNVDFGNSDRLSDEQSPPPTRRFRDGIVSMVASFLRRTSCKLWCSSRGESAGEISPVLGFGSGYLFKLSCRGIVLCVSFKAHLLENWEQTWKNT